MVEIMADKEILIERRATAGRFDVRFPTLGFDRVTGRWVTEDKDGNIVEASDDQVLNDPRLSVRIFNMMGVTPGQRILLKGLTDTPAQTKRALRSFGFHVFQSGKLAWAQEILPDQGHESPLALIHRLLMDSKG